MNQSVRIHDRFLQALKDTPHAIALEKGDLKLTYQQLDDCSTTLAHALFYQDDSPVVAVSTTRSLDMIISVLAILKAGKAYLPLDPSYPPARLHQIIQDSGIRTCLAPETEQYFFHTLGLKPVIPATDTSATHTDWPQASGAYVLYTSGSTGTPKGVCMGHEALANLLQWQQKQSKATNGSRTLQFAPLSFDVSFQEIFATLTTGGTLVLMDDDLRLDPQRLLRFIGQAGIHRLFLPFVALQYLAEAADASQFFPTCLQEVMTAGEQLKITPQVLRLFTNLPGTVLYNQYGPTECHVVTQLKLDGDPAKWPALPSIGQPIDHTDTHLLNEALQPVIPGETGELCISGISLAEGYLNQPALTAEKFTLIALPAGLRRLYRTGDLARLLPNGELELLGRKDEQVKVRGYRIELSEIEVALSRQPGVQQAVVTVHENAPGQKRLLAYLVANNASQNTATLRQALQEQLPDYMLPAAFIWIDKLPYTSSGKVNKKALPAPCLQRPELNTLYKAPVTTLEKQLATLWSSLLQLDKVGTDDNFFELGGNSLLAIKTVAGLQEQYNIQLPITKIYQYTTIHGLAAWLKGYSTTAAQPLVRKNTTSTSDDIAVISMAGRFPGADTIPALWNILREGQEVVSFFSPQDLDPSLSPELINNPAYIRARGVLERAAEFDAAFFGITPKMATLMDPQQRIFLTIAWEALETAGYLPAHYTGSIGVFAGSGNNSYYLNNVLPNTESIEQAGRFQVMTWNEKDYMASRIAYALNLKGPAVSIYTACSTSLLAIAQAVDSIRLGHCDVALAGGVSVTAPLKSGHLFQEGTMLSADGHTRSFDARAQGTVFSDGGGVVLLKSRAAAERDGDTIYALIKGAGVNNDGSSKGSFTAPSVTGQAGAIATALAAAGVEASTISYVEAHGTATPIGDPIEIEALNLAFGPQQRHQYCAIGSIKSNLGHLTAAAGVAGFIKTVLSLHHRQLPPSLHYQQPNPAIDFAESPFFVNTQLTAWNNTAPRRAGVSSFGVGGTNVHVILEEAPATKPIIPSTRPVHLLTWSAKTTTSLQTYATNLATHLINTPGISIADAAYTLQTTRQTFAHRRFVLANQQTLATSFTATAAPGTTATITEEKNRDVVFLFPGQGSQYVNMGLDLYRHEPIFRQAIDTCAQLLEKELGEDIRHILYPDVPTDSTTLNHTYYAQPAIFTVSFALAKLWMSWGIQPVAMAGHSIGELVAAHLAGVFTLPDALQLIAARGRLVSKLPGGHMLAVRAGSATIQPLLPSTLSLAAINGPQACVVAGTKEAIATFEARLVQEDIAHKILPTSHAFHSAMMEPAVAVFEQIVQGVHLQVPQTPIVSTVTGQWLRDTEATDPAYWAQHLRRTVRFSDAMTTLREAGHQLFLESGPGNVITNLMRQQSPPPILTLASIEPGTDKQDHTTLLNTVGQLWLQGITLNWEEFHIGHTRQKIALPTYAFDKTSFWINPPATPVAPIRPKSVSPLTTPPPPDALKMNVMRKEQILRQVKTLLENASGIEMDSIAPDRNFLDIGLDSLLLTQVSLNVKKEFGVPVTFRQLMDKCNSPELLARLIDEQLPPEAATPAPPAPGPAPTYMQPALPATGDNHVVIGLMAQQIQLLAQQINLLQGNTPPPALSTAMPTTHVALPTPTNHTTAPAPQLVPATANLAPDELEELKKPFGATARIEKKRTGLTSVQQTFLDNLIRRYTEKTKKSKAYTQQNRAHMADPRVVSGFRPLTKEIVYSLVVHHSKGSRLWDIDGNEYIDALNGFGSNLLGYQTPHILQALQQQLTEGYEVGPQHHLSGEVSRLLCTFTGFDRAALCNTGSEAVLGAMRIARTVTGRSTIIAFSGSYHGIVDEVIVRGTKKLKSFPAAPGIMPEAVQNMLILDYGTEESLAIIRERAHELAAVLVEPVQSRRPEFQPVDFLKEIRKITAASGTALIFDEVITGFRMHPGGAQALFGVKADIGTYGKVIGAGIPIGAIIGKKEWMDALDGGFWQFGDDSAPEAGVTYFAGTFVRHPLALAASKAALEYMQAKGPTLQQQLNEMTSYLANSLNDICKRTESPLYVTHFGSLWKIKFREELPYTELLFTLMREKGIHILDGFPCFLSEAHTKDEINTIVTAFDESLQALLEIDLLPASAKNNGHTESSVQEATAQQPPVPGAKLGRDPEGKPGWFINDPHRPGKFMQVH